MADAGYLNDVGKAEALKHLGDIYKLNQLNFRAAKYYRRSLFYLTHSGDVKQSDPKVVSLISLIKDVDDRKVSMGH